VKVLVGWHFSGGVKSNSHAQTYSHMLGESTRKFTAVSRKSGNRKLEASKAMACKITNSTPLSATDDRFCVKCNEFFPVSCFMSENGAVDHTLCNKHEAERNDVRLSRPVMVDLVLTSERVNRCMVQCPACGNVNYHGLGDHAHLFLWGHRGCDGRIGCGGYVLVPGAVVKKASGREWRRLSQPLLKIQKHNLRVKRKQKKLGR